MTDSILVANSTETSVMAKGDLELEADVGGDSSMFTVSDVLCIPDLAVNLLSVHKICGNGHRVVFTND